MPLIPETTRLPASEGMFPSLAEMLEGLDRNLPDYLINELRERYDAHGWEYKSRCSMADDTGTRPINSAWLKDSRQLAREEIIDAIWNLLVLNLKERKDWKTKLALRSCLKAQALLQ